MKYMVMECHPGYAVVLDEAGRFTKVANIRYKVGQTVTDVVELSLPQLQAVPEKKRNVRWLYSLAAMAACLLLILIPAFLLPQVTYASVYMTINPEVRIDVNRRDIVVGLEGINGDGQTLIEDYHYQKKELDLVVDELVDRAIDMGFLHEGGQITLELDAEDNTWVVTHSDSLDTQLNEYLTDKITVTIEVTDKNAQKITIPIEEGDSGYGESDYGQITPAETTVPASTPASDSGYGDTAYSDTTPSVSDSAYGDSVYSDGQTDYGDQTVTEPTDDDDQTDYADQSATEPTDVDGQTDYQSATAPADDDGESDYDDSDDGDANSDYE